MFSFKQVTMGLAMLVAAATLASAEDAPHFKLNVGGAEGAGGTVKGVVKFDGKQANRKPIRMEADPTCNAAHAAGSALDERWVFGENDTLQNVFVYVSKGLEGKTFKPLLKAELDQFGCVYVPHVSGVMTGQEVVILNSDSTLHNVKASPKVNAPFNEGMPVKGMKITKSFAKPELGVEFKCDVHPWMQAYLHVMDHPFFAVTQADGTFELKGLPAGKYTISTWHEFNKFSPDKESYEVEVKDGGVTELVVTYAPPKK